MMAQEPGNTRPGKRCCFAQSKKNSVVLSSERVFRDTSRVKGTAKSSACRWSSELFQPIDVVIQYPLRKSWNRLTSPTPPIPMRSISGMRFVYDVLLSHWVDNGGPGICWRSWPIWWLLLRTSWCPSLFKVTKVIIPTFIYFSEGSKLETTSKFCFHLLLIWLVVSSYYMLLLYPHFFLGVLELYQPFLLLQADCCFTSSNLLPQVWFTWLQPGPSPATACRWSWSSGETPESGWFSKENWLWINTYENTIFSGMNIHFNPAILRWTEGVQGFDTLPIHQQD